MNKSDPLEEVMIRLIGLDWLLDGIKDRDIPSMKSLIKFFKEEVSQCLKSFDKHYLKLSTPKKRAPKKEVKSAVKKGKKPKNSIKKHKQVKRRRVS